MATAPILDIEACLIELFRQQQQCYVRLVDVTRAFPQDCSPGHIMDEQLTKMHSIMDEVNMFDGQIATLRDDWRQRGGKPGPVLQAILDEVEQLILAAMERIQAAEKAATESRDRLAPQVSAESRRRKMTTAYNNSRLNQS